MLLKSSAAAKPVTAICVAALSALLQASLALSGSYNNRPSTQMLVQPLHARAGPAQADRSLLPRLAELYGKSPLSFETNQGQIDRSVKFFSRGNGYRLFLTPSEAGLASTAPVRSIVRQSETANLPFTTISMRFIAANSNPEMIGVGELPHRSNYLFGKNRQRWSTNVANYSKVKYQNLYKGVDLVFYGNQEHLEYDFVVAPGADHKAIRLGFDGAQKISLGVDGSLALTTPAGEIHQHKPRIYQYVDGRRKEIGGNYVINQAQEVRFEVAEYDTSRELVIDPVLTFSTLLGGGVWDSPNCITVDSVGNVYVTGVTSSLDFPVTSQAFQSTNHSIPDEYEFRPDVFVAKLSPTGAELLYSTYIGGAGGDEGHAIAVDAEGNAYVAGSTSSTDFPTTPGAFQGTIGSSPRNDELPSDAFILKLNPTGTGLVYSTYLGGGFYDVATAMTVSSAGNAYLTGYTISNNFPTTPGAFQQSSNSRLGVAFITEVDRAGTGLIYSTLLGGSSGAEARGIAIDPAGNAYVTGETLSDRDFPTTPGAFQRSAADFYSAFVTKLNPSGSTLIYSTYLGGKSFGGDEGNAIAVDSRGYAYITGFTNSPDFPVTHNAFQKRKGKNKEDYIGDAFVTKLNQTGTDLIYSTFLGGAGYDVGQSIAVDSTGCAYVTGYAPSPNFPITNAIQRRIGEGSLLMSSDGGNTWDITTLTSPYAYNIVFDPMNQLTFYINGSEGALKTTDGGNTWTAPVVTLPFNRPLYLFAIDPQTPSTLFASDTFALYKSADGGDSWKETGFTEILISNMAIDPKDASTIYLGAYNGIYKSTDGGDTWKQTGLRRPPDPQINTIYGPFITALVIDPQTTSTIYTQAGAYPFKSTDGGDNWSKIIVDSDELYVSLRAVDPRNPATLYASAYDDGRDNIYKSTDGGKGWHIISRLEGLNGITIDPMTPSIIYANTDAGELKSTDGGINWDSTALVNLTGALFINPGSPSTQYFATHFNADAFIAKLNAEGTSLWFSTYLGGHSYDAGKSIAVDSAGSVYVAGETSSSNLRTTPGALTNTFSGGRYDAFIIKLGAPRIIRASINHKALSLQGENFDQGAVILLNGEEQKTAGDDTNPATALIGKKAARKIRPGQSLTIQVRNSDGTSSKPFTFTRPLD